MSRLTANCPNCGAAVTFLWSSAVQTTCPFCKCILVRHDVDLRTVGEVSDLSVATSAIQIRTEGQYRGTAFTVVGRIIYEEGVAGEGEQEGSCRWNEWHVRLADDTSAWLCDAEGAFAVMRVLEDPGPVPARDEVALGQAYAWNGTLYTVTSLVHARYRGVEGELPMEYWGKNEVLFADCRSQGPSFASLNFSEAKPLLFVGEYEGFEQLAFQNLRAIAGW